MDVGLLYVAERLGVLGIRSARYFLRNFIQIIVAGMLEIDYKDPPAAMNIFCGSSLKTE
jgi:hypothetical protein